MNRSILDVKTYGSDEPTVLGVHGITGFGARFARTAEAVGGRWLCPDLRGHGGSTAPAPWRTEDHVDDLIAVLDDHGVERADVVGHSFGGHVVLHLLATAPERVNRVALLDPATLLGPDKVEAGALSYARDPGWGTREEAEAEIGTWFPTAASQSDLGPEIDTNLVEDAGRWRMRFSPAVIVAAYGEMARPLPALPAGHDVLLLEADPANTSVSDGLRETLGSTFGDRLQRRVIDDAGHVLFRTHPDACADALRDFLSW